MGSLPQNKSVTIVIVDNHTEGMILHSHLKHKNIGGRLATNLNEALRCIADGNAVVAVVELQDNDFDAIEIIERIKQAKPDIAVLAKARNAPPDLIFRASKAGADDFVAGVPHPPDVARRILALVQERRPAHTLPQAIREQVRGQSDFTGLFGTSPKMEEVKATLEQVADTNVTVLIRGESGTGKEVVARMIYAQSSRREKPFVKVNCAAIPHELLESELFGYEAGAFTGANRQKLGKFEQANFGTIFLDEISEMHPALQAKLLHVLQDGEFARLGGKRDIAVDVRVLAATNKPLERAVEEGLFREDLFYRLNVVTIHIPPLRERREEIPIFIDYFVRKYSEYYGKQPKPFSDNAIAKMMEYPWPGNIRELENLVKRYVIVGNEAQIIRELATHKPIVTSFAPTNASRNEPAPVTPPPAFLPAADGHELEMPSLLEIGRRAAMQAEREAIERVLQQTRWNRRQAAKILKISYKALLNKLKAMEEQAPQSKHKSA